MSYKITTDSEPVVDNRVIYHGQIVQMTLVFPGLLNLTDWVLSSKIFDLNGVSIKATAVITKNTNSAKIIYPKADIRATPVGLYLGKTELESPDQISWVLLSGLWQIKP